MVHPFHIAPNSTDIRDLIQDARDAFDIQSWIEAEQSNDLIRTDPVEHPDHIEMHELSEDVINIDEAEVIDSAVERQINVDAHLQEHGVEAIDTDVINYPKVKTIKVPLTDEKIIAAKKLKLTDAMRWLAETCLYILHRAGIKLKQRDGHTIRVKK